MTRNAIDAPHSQYEIQTVSGSTVKHHQSMICLFANLLSRLQRPGTIFLRPGTISFSESTRYIYRQSLLVHFYK